MVRLQRYEILVGKRKISKEKRDRMYIAYIRRTLHIFNRFFAESQLLPKIVKKTPVILTGMPTDFEKFSQQIAKRNKGERPANSDF